MTSTKADGFDPEFNDAPADWSRMYRRCGLQVVPCRTPSEGGNWKRPALANWITLQEEMVPDATFERWYSRGGEHYSRVNMGLLTGRASGNVWVLDLDEYKPGALEWWRGVLAVHNNSIEPETWQQTTGGGGRQILFRAPEGFTVPTNKTNVGVDIRGQGGFAVLPPSMHSSGKSYAWRDGFTPWEIEIADAPGWLLEAIVELIARHGGKEAGLPLQAPTPGIVTPTPEAQVDAFGQHVDGRDHYMRDLVWASVVDWYRECPIPPAKPESINRMDEAYASYLRNTKSRLPGDQTNEVKLELEGRGYTAFQEKWHYAMRQWGDKVAAAAGVPQKEKRQILSEERPAATPSIVETECPFPIDPRTLLPRDWTVPGLLLNKNMSLLVAPPGIGKSLLTLQIACMVAAGFDWGGWTVRKSAPVMILNTEDDFDEMRFRLFAAADAMGIPHERLAGRIHIVRNPNDVVVCRTDKHSGVMLRTPVFDALKAKAEDLGVGLVVADPFAETFEGDENSNSEIKWAAIAWRELARSINASVLLVHHTRKYAKGMAGDADAARGGGAVVGVARVVSTMFNMEAAEASAFGIPEEDRFRYVRFDDAKSNMSALSGRARWFERQAKQYNIGSTLLVAETVPALVPWKPPGLLGTASVADINDVLDVIAMGVIGNDGRATGDLMAPDARSGERWAGTPVMHMLGVEKGHAKKIIREWLASGLLFEDDYRTAGRQVRRGVKVDNSKRPGEVSHDAI